MAWNGVAGAHAAAVRLHRCCDFPRWDRRSPSGLRHGRELTHAPTSTASLVGVCCVVMPEEDAADASRSPDEAACGVEITRIPAVTASRTAMMRPISRKGGRPIVRVACVS